MFWRQNDALQSDKQAKQPSKRLNFSFNVKIAVNVNTKMSTTHINDRQATTTTTTSTSTKKQSTKQLTKPATFGQQLQSLGHHLGSCSSSHGSISTLLIVNLLLLLLLSLCCDVCRSHDQGLPLHLNYTETKLPEISLNPSPGQSQTQTQTRLQPQAGILPILDSDVVEKLTVWHKHAAAAPPTVAAGGVAIGEGGTSDAGLSAADAVAALTMSQKQATTPANKQTDPTGIDERIALERVTRDCVQRCIVEEDLFLDEFGIKCERADSSEKCYKTRCTKGCAQWYRALKEFEPCQEACSSTQFYAFDMPCIGACEMAQRDYWHLQRLAMAELVQRTQPEFVQPAEEQANGIAMRLTIKWAIHFPENYLASRPFNIQYQYVEQQEEVKDMDMDMELSQLSNDWYNLADYDCDEYFVCEILEGLMPYTYYRFRFELPFGESSTDVLYSPSTSIYKTPAEGAPISAPIINDLLALDHSHVAVHWQSGRFTNGPLVAYRVTLSPVLQPQPQNSSREQLLSAESLSCIFANLKQQTNYSVQITMLNAQGEGPAALSTIVTQPREPSSTFEPINSVLLAGEYSIVWKSLEPAGETRIVYQSEQLLSDFAVAQGEQRLWVVDVMGQLQSLLLDQPTTLKTLPLLQNGTQLKPKKLCYDWLHQRLYMSIENSAKNFSLLSSDANGGQIEYVSQQLNLAVEQLEVDPLNGWLFWSDIETLWRLNLATRQHQRIMQIHQPVRFAYNAEQWLLTLLNRSDETPLHELSYDGVHMAPLHLLPASLSFVSGDWQSFAHDATASTLLLANGTQLLRFDYDTQVLDNWPMRDLEWCWALMPLTRRRQPRALRPGRPHQLRALLSAQAAQINWKAPKLNAYQTAVAANDWAYELQVLDVASHSIYHIRNIRTQHFEVEKLQANNLYELRVRATNAEGEAGEWAVPHAARTWPLGEHHLRWASSTGRLYESNELGGEVQQLEVHLTPDPGALTMINGSLGYYVNGAAELHCVNLVHAELNCSAGVSSTGIPHVGDVAYDWRGARLYWTDLARDCVVRMDAHSGQRELLPIFGARELSLDAAQGHIYYTTSMRLARRTLNGQLERDELEYYHVNGLAGRIASFTLDLKQRHIYWLVNGRQVTDGKALHLYRAPLAVGAQQAILLDSTLIDVDVRTQTLQHVAPLEALLWLAADGHSAYLTRMAAPEQMMRLELQSSSSELLSLTAVQLSEESTAYPMPDTSVVPQSVASDSVRIDDGYWDDFHVRWQPVGTAENYSVHYKVLLEYAGQGARLQTYEVSTPFLRIRDMQQAQLSMRISITPHTAWRSGSTTSVTLATPAAAPTQPKRLRVFVEREAMALQTSNISALIRWDTPEHVQGASVSGLAYRVYCWEGDQLHAERLHNESSNALDAPLEVRVEDLRADETYTFQVQAFVAATGASAGAATATHALHVAPEVQAVPRLIYATAEYIGELDLDTQQRRRLVHTASVVEHLTLLQGEQRLLWVNENVELMTHVPGSAPAKLARMRAEVLALTIDWVARIVYWAELDASESPQAAAIYRLQLCQFEGRILHGERLWRTPRGHLLRDLIALPHAQTLLWLEYELGARNATMVGRNLSDGSSLNFKTAAPLWRLFEGSLEPDAETLNLVDHAGRLCSYDVARQLCTALRTHFNVLNDEIAQLARDSGYLYALRNNSVRAYSRRKQQLEYLVDVAEVRLLRAYNYQAYPAARCLLLPKQAQLANSEEQLDDALVQQMSPQCEEQQCSLKLPALHAADECYLPVPGLRYAINLTERLQEGHEESQIPFRFQLQGHAGGHLNLSSLQPFTAYDLQLRLSSYYQQRLDMPMLELPLFTLHTAPATPSAPRNFSVRVLSPTALEISWLPPLEMRSAGVWYMLHWQQDQQLGSGAELRLEEPPDHRHVLNGLQPQSGYDVWLHVHATPQKFNQSVTLSVRTYSALPPLELIEISAYELRLSWAGTPDNLSTLALECQVDAEGQLSVDLGVNQHNYTDIFLAELQPKTRYECQLALHYADTPDGPVYHGPRFAYETFGDRPSAPGRPKIEHIAGEIFKVSWPAARPNGADIITYSMEALQSRRSRRRRRRSTHSTLLAWAEEPTAIEDQWIEYCNTTELSCIVRELHSRRLLLFRVRALNEPYGWGPYSEDSDRVAEPFVSPEKRGSLVLAIIAPAAIVSSCVLALVLVRKVQKRRLRAKKLLEKSRPSIWSNLSTLQTQQQLLAARNRAFSMTSHSTLYTGGPLSDADIALLPQISWSQLTLLRFLGSGAFGEVYEGQLKYEDEPQPQRVAIKTLRKGASEFAELLQEAQLMSNFKHENIVALIGVCFDSESISLIMEHMEAGDLLSYLRAARPNSEQPQATLQLHELVAMCIDVATGCSYLEDMHFVHRDLACRNCLVSSLDARRRVVKIGDFGLARDIYKSDYYRKEGEGLLPVRWMSPESLIDGVFTTQSDVWAFGVLCWEILTLGQQPYAARNNFEVLAHVKDGGRLQQPEQCPEKLYALLLQCWCTEPDERPSFRRCVNTLHGISTDLRRTQMPSNGLVNAVVVPSDAASTAIATSPTIHKAELKVRFDESEEQNGKVANPIVTHGYTSTPTISNDCQQLYANEGISRL